MSANVATYYRPDAAPKVFACRPGQVPGTVDLLGEDGEPVVTDCPVIEDPETAVKLPNGYATIAEADRKAPAQKRRRKDTDGDGEPD